MSSALGTSARATPHPPNRTTAAMRDMNVSGMRNLHRSNLLYTCDGFAQDHAEPVRDAVVGEHDVRRAGEEAFVELEPRHAPAHALGILHHDVVARGA